MSKKTTFKLITDTAALNKAIASIKTRGTKLQADMHTAAVSCLDHADKHGNVTPMRNLLDALPSMTRKNALKAWAEQFGKFVYNEETKTLDYAKDKATTLQAAIDEPFYQFSPEPEYKPLNMAAEIGKLMTRISNAQKHGETVNPDTIAVLQALKDGKAVTIADTATTQEPANA